MNVKGQAAEVILAQLGPGREQGEKDNDVPLARECKHNPFSLFAAVQRFYV